MRIDLRTIALWVAVGGAPLTATWPLGAQSEQPRARKGPLPPALGPSTSVPATPELIGVIFHDLDDNGSADSQEIVTLVFNIAVDVRPAAASDTTYLLPVAGDNLGSGFGVSSNPFNRRKVDIELGSSATLTIPGPYNPSNTNPGNPSGLGILDGGAFLGLFSGLPTKTDTAGTAKDIRFTLVSNTQTIDSAGGTVNVVNSPDAAHTQHRITFPPGAIISPTDFTLRPPPDNVQLTQAIQVTGEETFALPAVLELEYLQGDVDSELGQLERAMTIHQLVETEPGVFTPVPVSGPQTVDTVNNTVTVLITSLNPAGSSGGTGFPSRARSLTPAPSTGEVGIFAAIPAETIERGEGHIKATGGSAPGVILGPTNPIIGVGADGVYTLHHIEFPGYVTTTAVDPERITVAIEQATIFERISQTGGTSFPTGSASLFIVTAENATAEAVEFTDAVTIRVEFQDDDLIGFTGSPEDSSKMDLVHDVTDGAGVNFQFVSGTTRTLFDDGTSSYVEVTGVTGLTGASGKGVWGAVANPTIPAEITLFGAD